MGNLYLEMLEAVAPPGHSQLFLLWRYKPLAPLGHMGNLYLEMLEAVVPPGHSQLFLLWRYKPLAPGVYGESIFGDVRSRSPSGASRMFFCACYKPFAPLGHGLYGGVFFVIGVQIQAIGIESCKAQACTVAQVCDASKDAMISTA